MVAASLRTGHACLCDANSKPRPGGEHRSPVVREGLEFAAAPKPRPSTGKGNPLAGLPSGERGECEGLALHQGRVAGAALDTLASRVSPPDEARSGGRARRYSLRRAAGRVLPGERVAKCGGWVVGTNVTLHSVPGQGSHFGGLETCGSVWACPVCAAKVAAKRGEEVSRLLSAHYRAGGTARLMTLTIPHFAAQSAKELRWAVSTAWRKVKQGEPWKRAKLRHGYVGDVRALEVTHGANGWHPHIHALVLFEAGTPLDVQDSLGTWFFERWRRAIERSGFGTCSRDAFKFDLVTAESGAAEYVAKWGAALELTQAATKQARRGGRNPFRILADYDEFGRVRDTRLFREYALSFKGARQLTWTRGLRDLYGLGPDQSDEVLAEDVSLPKTHEATVGFDVWHMMAKAKLTASFLDEKDARGFRAAITLLGDHGIHVVEDISPSLERGRFVPLLRLARSARGSPGDVPGPAPGSVSPEQSEHVVSRASPNPKAAKEKSHV